MVIPIARDELIASPRPIYLSSIIRPYVTCTRDSRTNLNLQGMSIRSGEAEVEICIFGSWSWHGGDGSLEYAGRDIQIVPSFHTKLVLPD